MSARIAILNRLTHSRNLAVERAVEFALASASPIEQLQLAEVLLERNQRSGWISLIRAYNRLGAVIQQKILDRPRDLFGPLAETMQEVEGPARENVITIVQHCSDPRLVYLLAEALMDARNEVREIAGNSLLETVRRFCNRILNADTPNSPDADAQIRRAIDFALRKFKSHRQSTALQAALIYERQIDSSIWPLFQDAYDDLTRAATITMRAPPEPAVIHSLLLALASPLKPAAMAGIAAIESLPLAKALAAHSYRLVDPLLADAARSIPHLKVLPALRKEPPWNTENWADWLRLIESVGLQPTERLSWLTRMWESALQAPSAVGWRISLVRAIADSSLPEAGTVLTQALSDDDERVARFTARIMLHRRIPEWRHIAATQIPRNHHISVRKLAALAAHVDPGKSPTTPGPRGFDRAWKDYQKQPPVVQHSTARTVATDPLYAEQLRDKLQSKSPPDIAQALKMIFALPNVSPYRTHIISLCGHEDPRIAAMAVRLIGRIEDPRLKDLLEAAVHHADPRVRANAVESMEQLHITDKSQQVLTMLNSRHNRERANAIKAIGQFNFATAKECLLRMLADPNPLHRMSALWVVGQFDLLEVMRQVALLARRDPNVRVRKRAAEMLDTLSGNIPSPL